MNVQYREFPEHWGQFYIYCECAKGMLWFLDVSGAWVVDVAQATRLHEDIAAAILDTGALVGPGGSAETGWPKPRMIRVGFENCALEFDDPLPE
jgi:hypothetical protein